MRRRIILEQCLVLFGKEGGFFDTGRCSFTKDTREVILDPIFGSHFLGGRGYEIYTCVCGMNYGDKRKRFFPFLGYLLPGNSGWHVTQYAKRIFFPI